MKYKVHIVRKSVKHLRIRVVDTSTVLATAPKRMSQEKILSFIKTKESWIEKHLKSFANAENYFEI